MRPATEALAIEEVGQRARAVKAAEAMVETVNGIVRVMKVPQSNQFARFNRDLEALGPVQRVVFLGADGNRLDELALQVAREEARALGSTEVNLLTVRELLGVFNQATAANVREFAGVSKEAVKTAGAASLGWQAAYDTQRKHIAVLEEELREVRGKLSELLERAHESEQALAVLAVEAENSGDPMKKEAAEKLGQLLELAAAWVNKGGE